jgi:glycosyltransferase involved in cell wall biosynthesis
MSEKDATTSPEQAAAPPRVLLVANVLTHYRLPLYEELQDRIPLELIFFSDGQEWYWRRTEEPSGQTLRDARWLKGWWIGRTRIAPGLITTVWRSRADVIVKDATGKFAIPVTYVIARLRRKPFVFWASLSEHPTNFIHQFTRPLLRYLYRRSDAIVTYGRHVSRHVIAEGARPEHVLEAPQAVRPVGGTPPDANRWQRPLQLLYVGRLETWKGLHVLLAALAKLGGNDWRLRVVGRGSQESVLRSSAAELGIAGRVEFLGPMPNRSLATLYAASAVLIVPSIRTATVTEVWALVVNEAMQAGTLVVASDCIGAVQDGLVQDGYSGLTFPSGDAAGLAERLRTVMDPGQTNKMMKLAAAGQQAVGSYTFAEAARSFVVAAHLARHARRPATRTTPE